MLLSSYTDHFSATLALWISTASPTLVPEIARAGGIIVHPEADEITILVPEKFCIVTLENLEHSNAMSLLAANINTYICYQFKGFFMGSGPCTAAEDSLQLKYLDAFTDILTRMGYDKENYFKAYHHQPSVALTFKPLEVYEQTPKTGTGNRISLTAL